MKLTAFFLLIGTLHLSASGNAQRISLTLNNAPLASVFKEIERQTNFNFIYGKEQLEKSRKVNISVSNMALENVLVLVFRDQPLTYTIVDNFIVIKKKLNTVQRVENVAIPARVPDPVKGTVLNSGKRSRDSFFWQRLITGADGHFCKFSGLGLHGNGNRITGCDLYFLQFIAYMADHQGLTGKGIDLELAIGIGG